MTTDNYTKTIRQLSKACIDLEGLETYTAWTAEIGLHANPLRDRVNLIESHLNELSDLNVIRILENRRDEIAQAFATQLWPDGKLPNILLEELAQIEIELDKQ